MEKHELVTFVVLGLLAAVAIIAITTNVIAISGNTVQQDTVLSKERIGNEDEETISVVGTAKRVVLPDRLKITLGVETDAVSARDAVKENAKIMNAIIDSLKALGIKNEEMQTTSYNIYPLYDENGKVIAFRVNNMISIDTDKLELAGNIIDVAVDAGANRFYGLYFYVSDERIKELRADLLKEAVNDAKAKAEELLTPLGLKIASIKTASIIEGYQPFTPYYMEHVIYKEARTPIVPGEFTVSLSVQVTFVISKL